MKNVPAQVGVKGFRTCRLDEWDTGHGIDRGRCGAVSRGSAPTAGASGTLRLMAAKSTQCAHHRLPGLQPSAPAARFGADRDGPDEAEQFPADGSDDLRSCSCRGRPAFCSACATAIALSRRSL